MCVTFLESEKQPADKLFYKDDHILFIKKHSDNKKFSFAFLGFESMKIEKYDVFKLKKENVIDLRNNKKTVLLFVPEGGFHLLVDFFNKIVNLCETDLNFELILNFSADHVDGSRRGFDESFKVFLLKFLNDHGIGYTIIDDWTDIDQIIVNDFIFFNKTCIESSPITHSLFLKYFSKYINDINQKPFRKVYLNRKNYSERQEHDTTLSYNQDNRMQNEQILQEYLFKNGVECLSLENKFNTFEEQINYFYSVKILIAATSAGLTNCLYMQPGSILVELVTPQLIEHNTSDGPSLGISINSLWQPITSVKEIDHISVSNLERNAIAVLNKIKNTTYLQKVIEENYE